MCRQYKGLLCLFTPVLLVLISSGPEPSFSYVCTKSFYCLPQENQLNTDELFAKARELAQKGQREKAKKILRNILEENPDYHEVRTYLARVHMWDGEYESAEKEIRRVLRERLDYLFALTAAVDLEYWTDNPEKALEYADQGLHSHPESENLLIRKARILMKLDRFEEAADTLERLFAVDPSHPEGRRLYDRLQSSTQLFKLYQRYRYDFFERDGSNRNWHLATAGLSVKSDVFTLIGRINYASRTFGSEAVTGTQYDFDLYPKFAEGFYAYLNAGFSGARIFPVQRYGGELYFSLPLSYEFSAGARYLNFSSSDVWIYTGSLGKYYKDYWFSLRPYVTSKEAGLSVSGNLYTRKYLGDPESYWELVLGFGSTPIDIFYLEDIQRFNSYKIGLELQQRLSKHFIIKGKIRYEREEFRRNTWSDRYVFELRLEEIIYKKY